MREEVIKVYQFDELDDAAKEKAREWWRSCESQEFSTEFLYDDFERVATILGIEFKTRPVKLYGGGTRYEPCIWWSGFWSQGDGACFEGSYSYAKGCAKKIRDYAPKDARLHAIADALTAAQKKHGYKVAATVKHSGHYYHEYCTEFDVFHADDNYRGFEDDTFENVREALREFMRWIYRMLESEYEDRMSDENVDESIRANDYEFTEDGEIH